MHCQQAWLYFQKLVQKNPRQFFNKIDHSDDVIKKERLTVLALKEEVT